MTDVIHEDYYEYLQISPNADLETIERVYRLLAKKYHPDNTETGNSEKFNIVTTAYKTLTDPEKRAAYDVQYDDAKKREWRAFSQMASSDATDSDNHVRRTLLSILYIKRRDSPGEPGVGSWQLEKQVELPEKIVEFHLWYLKEKKWITRTETGGFAITAAGVDEIESDGVVLGKDLLLTESATESEMNDQVKLLEAQTPSNVSAYEKAVDSLEAKVALNPDNVAALVGLTYFNNRLGRQSAAVAAARKIRTTKPDFSIKDFDKTLRFKFRIGGMKNASLLKEAGFQ
ncbi:MAG: DnaJ domain-containing protein [Desulfobacteraceae bacterium]|jgi:curved DNA-binding protein CbpA|nr:DnaJ domain-containing protein [Desulfobacteraceae bacterium]